MNTEQHAIQVGGIKVQVVRKAIKNLHLGVYPPNGRVRVAAPLALSNQAVRLAVIGRLGWIGRQRAKFQRQPRMSRRELVSGESHYFLGRRFRLRVTEQAGSVGQGVRRSRSYLELVVRSDSAVAHRERLLNNWYRARLREVATPLIQQWQTKLDVQVASWGIKRMRTKWGACNSAAARVWLNLELVKSPPECIEYIIVHELVHLCVRHHDEQFRAMMEMHLPDWQNRRERLNTIPLVDAVWPC
jgi:predicted metal-dependent hydrolase